ncbi:MAG: transketolase [Coriobacteriia bacterium]|nr:transketolase [Coriobacteriia bacterium]MCL2751055.1 transketolase [Coriobacteriia bacterium]
MTIEELQEKARRMRCHVVRMTHAAGSGHPGGSLSAADIMAVLWFGGFMRYRADEPSWKDRDRFVLSKGHAAPILYAAMAEAGYLKEEELLTLRQLDSRLQGHPDMLKLPGVELSAGSLGQGLSVAVGMALGLAMGGGDQKVFCLVGDGECQEGQIWEATMYAAHQKTDNLIAIIDNNRYQIDGAVNDICRVEDLASKFEHFGWLVWEVDGHNVEALLQTLKAAVSLSGQPGPRAIIAHTVKGKGVSFMENTAAWHGKAPNAEECERALADLGVST